MNTMNNLPDLYWKVNFIPVAFFNAEHVTGDTPETSEYTIITAYRVYLKNTKVMSSEERVIYSIYFAVATDGSDVEIRERGDIVYNNVFSEAADSLKVMFKLISD